MLTVDMCILYSYVPAPRRVRDRMWSLLVSNCSSIVQRVILERLQKMGSEALKPIHIT